MTFGFYAAASSVVRSVGASWAADGVAAGGLRWLVAQAAAMPTTAMIRPVSTGAGAPKALNIAPPASGPTAMPRLTAEGGSEAANWPPGPARAIVRSWSDGVMPKANTPQASI